MRPSLVCYAGSVCRPLLLRRLYRDYSIASKADSRAMILVLTRVPAEYCESRVRRADLGRDSSLDARLQEEVDSLAAQLSNTGTGLRASSMTAARRAQTAARSVRQPPQGPQPALCIDCVTMPRRSCLGITRKSGYRAKRSMEYRVGRRILRQPHVSSESAAPPPPGREPDPVLSPPLPAVLSRYRPNLP